jgi:hypothetical protein
MFELYRMNAGVGKLGIHLFSVYGFFFFFFSRKENPKANLYKGSFELGSFTSWLKVLKEECRIPVGDVLVKALKGTLPPCHSQVPHT